MNIQQAVFENLPLIHLGNPIMKAFSLTDISYVIKYI